MPRPPKNPPEVWERQKRLIYDHYIVENKTLKETVALMKLNHGFDATPREYIRRLDDWQFSKNLKKEDWQHVHKRKLDGKETDIQILDQPIRPQKMKRGLARYRWEPDNSLQSVIANGLSTRGIAIRTPSPEPTVRLSLYNIPWFQFQQNIESHLLSLISKLIPNMNWINSESSLPMYDSPGQLSMRTARSLLGCVLRLNMGNDAVHSDTFLLQRLNSILPQKHSTNSHVPSREPFFLLLKAYIYLASNGFVNVAGIDKFLTWMVVSGIIPFFNIFLRQQRRLRSPNVEIFLNRLLLSAIRLREESLVSSLLQYGVNPNYNNRSVRQENIYSRHHHFIFREEETITPLQLATIDRNSRICKLLLKHGANVDSQSWLIPFRPLELAILVQHGNLGIAEILVDNHANIELSYSEELFEMSDGHGLDNNSGFAIFNQRTLLMKAVESQNKDIALMLLNRGASPNEVSPFSGTCLQIATRLNDLEMIQILSASGARINPFDSMEEAAKEYFICKFQQCDSNVPYEIYIGYFTETRSDAFNSPIEIAAENDNYSLVQYLLQEGATVNHPLDHGKVWKQIPVPSQMLCDRWPEKNVYQDIKDRTKEMFQSALHFAVRNRNPDLTSLLLQHGANAFIDCRNGFGTTPLQLACQLERSAFEEENEKLLSLVQLLITSGAQVNAPAPTTDGRTALQAGAENGNQKLVEYLLGVGADVNAAPSTEGGMTTIEAAAKSGNPDLLICLVKHGAVLSLEIWQTALYAAVANCNLPATKQLLDPAMFSIDIPSSQQHHFEINEGTLQKAVESRNACVVKELLDYGADINMVFKGMTALCTAVRGGQHQMIDMLLSCGADPDPRGVAVTPLAIAACQGDIGAILTLLKAGSNIDRPSCHHPNGGWSRNSAPRPPLHWVISRYNLRYSIFRHHSDEFLERLKDVGCLLLDAGANPNEGGVGDRQTVLTLACRCMDRSFIEKAIECGADLNMYGGSNEYPIQAAAASNRIDIVRLLLDAGADINAPIGQKRRWGDHDMSATMIKLLLDAGADFDKPSLLAALIQMGLDDISLNWINDGVDVNCLNSNTHGTPLMAAVGWGHIGLIRALIHKGADVNTLAEFKIGPGNSTVISRSTALSTAVKSGDFNIVKLLIEQGADINPPTCSTILKLAAMHGRLDIAHLLLDNDNQINTLESRCRDAAKAADDNGHFALARILRSYKPHNAQARVL